MKKFFGFFIGLMLIAPASATITQYVSPTRANPQSGAVSAGSAPKYDFNTIVADDQQHIASTAYVKGAHNSALSAINYLGDSKQEILTNANVSDLGTGSVVTGVSAAAGIVTVTKGEVTLPVGGASGNNVTGHANIWVQ